VNFVATILLEHIIDCVAVGIDSSITIAPWLCDRCRLPVECYLMLCGLSHQRRKGRSSTEAE